jgi:XTP/dITP diphosphohydrolase
MPKLKYSSLTFVSRSSHKPVEYQVLLGLSDLKHLEIPVIEIQSMNLQHVVEEKFRVLTRQIPRDTPFFVEHTGLFIDAWGGLPGGLTSLFMELVGSAGICKMMRTYQGKERIARARTLIGYHCTHVTDGVPTHSSVSENQFFLGEVVGEIAPEPRGNRNFGWDDIFIAKGETRTYAEMTLDEKNKTSMRRVACDCFLEYLASNFEL